mgnify:CR=1 FL=1
MYSINLSAVERQILSNQNQILKIIDPVNEASYDENISILENGYETEYQNIFSINFYSTVSRKIGNEVIDILTMFREIANSLDLLSKEEMVTLDLEKLKFNGFTNQNLSHLNFAKFMIIERNEWEEQAHVELESIGNNLDRYKRMLTAAKNTDYNLKGKLTLDELKLIQQSV